MGICVARAPDSARKRAPFRRMDNPGSFCKTWPGSSRQCLRTQRTEGISGLWRTASGVPKDPARHRRRSVDPGNGVQSTVRPGIETWDAALPGYGEHAGILRQNRSLTGTDRAAWMRWSIIKTQRGSLDAAQRNPGPVIPSSSPGSRAERVDGMGLPASAASSNAPPAKALADRKYTNIKSISYRRPTTKVVLTQCHPL